MKYIFEYFSNLFGQNVIIEIDAKVNWTAKKGYGFNAYEITLITAASGEGFDTAELDEDFNAEIDSEVWKRSKAIYARYLLTAEKDAGV